MTSSSTPTTTTIEPSHPSSALRMGTRLPMAALHREKLRTFLTKPEIPTSQKSAENVTKKLDLDYDTMEYKSILPPVKAVVIGNIFYEIHNISRKSQVIYNFHEIHNIHESYFFLLQKTIFTTFTKITI